MPHDVNEINRADDEKALHHSVVYRYEAPQEVGIAQYEHDGIYLLSTTGDARTVFVLVQLVKEQHDAGHVQHVTAKPKNVHGCAGVSAELCQTSTLTFCMRLEACLRL
mmetsp:Transcript_123968/g.246843  ORF Transcript_123968/g.246843 Transcript_123968/m.246843 type:complete len:108 (-) Transcript_123968:3-326(-)